MKTALVLLMIGFAGLSRTLSASEYEHIINTSDIKQIEFDASSGQLDFTVAKVRYVLHGELSRSNSQAFSHVAANAAILGELRKSAKVSVWTDNESLDNSQPNPILRIVFRYDSLR